MAKIQERYAPSTVDALARIIQMDRDFMNQEWYEDICILILETEQKYFSEKANEFMDCLEEIHAFREISESDYQNLLIQWKVKSEEKHQASLLRMETEEEVDAERVLEYRQEYAGRNFGWKVGDVLPYESDYQGPGIKRFWYMSIDKNWFSAGNEAYADLPERYLTLCNKCATKSLVDPSVRAWAYRQYRGVGHCDICGDDDGLIYDPPTEGYAEGFHSGNSKWF